jgi:hypothetical protein
MVSFARRRFGSHLHVGRGGLADQFHRARALRTAADQLQPLLPGLDAEIVWTETVGAGWFD